MSRATVRPGPVRGVTTAPPSKSYTHRLLLAAHLSGRPSRLRRPLVANDTARTVAAVRRLGSDVETSPGEWTIRPRAPIGVIRPVTIDCGESGTTLRLVSAVAARQGRAVRFVGRGRLPYRPMAPLFRALRTLGANVTPHGSRAALPFELRGPIHGGAVELEVGESSQFTSALLLTLPTVDPDSRLRPVGVAVSEPYVRATIAVLRRQGVHVTQASNGDFRIPGGQRYRPVRATVPGDASSAAYLWAAAAITGGRVAVRGLDRAWPQADLAVLELLRQYGARIEESRRAIVVQGGERRPFRVVLDDAPDLYPLAGALAAAVPGRSVLVGADHVRGKESDRRGETERLARAMGARTRSVRGGLAIDGVARPRAFRLRRADDHRVVMSAAVGALAGDGRSEVDDASAVGKSFPGYFDALAALGVEVGLA